VAYIFDPTIAAASLAYDLLPVVPPAAFPVALRARALGVRPAPRDLVLGLEKEIHVAVGRLDAVRLHFLTLLIAPSVGALFVPSDSQYTRFVDEFNSFVDVSEKKFLARCFIRIGP